MSNREATRDAWFRLLREASSAAGRSSGLQRDDFGSSHILQDPGKPCAGKPSPGVACTCRTDQRSLQCCAEYRDTVSPTCRWGDPSNKAWQTDEVIWWQGKSVAQEGWRQRMTC